MDKSLQAKIKMQDEAKQAIRLAGYIACVLITVGGGKAKIMIDLALEILKKYKIKNILYLCDSTRLRDSKELGFPEQLEKWGTPELRKIIQLECYQTAHRFKDKQYDLLLADEVDFAMSTEYCKVFFNNKFRFKILLSGTLSIPKKPLLETIAPIVYTFTTNDAEDKGVLNKTKYYIYNYKMTDGESEEYIKYNMRIARAMAAEKTPQQINYHLGQRKELLYALESSRLAVRKIMTWLWNINKQTRLIIFCERTAQADKVCKYSYHGGNEKEDNLTKFQNGEISGLAVVGKIKRGVNLKNTNTAIFKDLSGTSTTEFMQRNGRIKRLPVAELATVIILCPWYKKTDNEGNTIWKSTIVDNWIYKSTSELNIKFENLKV